MPRLMSVTMTEQAVVERRKIVTRRAGWKFAKPGDRITLVRKAMGLKKGETVHRLAEVEIVSVCREPLRDMRLYPQRGRLETAREGFPGMSPTEFLQRFFIDAQGMSLDDEVTRIEWRYIDDEEEDQMMVDQSDLLSLVPEGADR